MSASYARAFARHETFHPRFGWLRKAVVQSDADHAIFLASDATSRLGVGKNMVRAIRYWGSAFGLLDEVPLPGRSRLSGSAPSALGRYLLGPEGVDPYLEEAASLWLLHWQLVRAGSLAPTWYLTFNRFPQRDFAIAELVNWLERELSREGIEAVASSSLEKDVSCLLHMYGPPASAHAGTTLTSPFSALRLIDPIGPKASRMRITYGPKSGLPPELVAIVALDAMRSLGANTQSIHVSRLATIEAGPGRAFGLSETEIATLLEDASSACAALDVGVYAGARRLSVSGDVVRVSGQLFAGIYQRDGFDIGQLAGSLEVAA